MFGSIGIQEVLLVLGIGLLLFGARKLPEIGKGLGKGIREFKKAQRAFTDPLTLEDSDKNPKA